MIDVCGDDTDGPLDAETPARHFDLTVSGFSISDVPAVRRRRKHHPDMAMPPVQRAARVDGAVQNVATRSLRKLDDVLLPTRRLPRGPVQRCEDVVLSAFLFMQIDKALSLDQTLVPCPWCGGDRTSYHPYRRPSGPPLVSVASPALHTSRACRIHRCCLRGHAHMRGASSPCWDGARALMRQHTNSTLDIRWLGGGFECGGNG